MSSLRVSAAVLVLVIGCSKSTPQQTEGSLGEVSLASKLPAGVAPTDDVKTYDTRRTGCAGARHDAPIDIRVRWKAFTKDDAMYVASYSVEVVKPAPGVLVQLEKEPNIMDVKVASSPKMTATKVTLKCTSRPMGNLFEETMTVYIRADGLAANTPVW